mgnify:CR=1 FL=1
MARTARLHLWVALAYVLETGKAAQNLVTMIFKEVDERFEYRQCLALPPAAEGWARRASACWRRRDHSAA